MFSKPDGNGDRTIYESYRTSCTVICSIVVNNKYSISDKDGADQNLNSKCTMCYTCTYMHLSYKIHTQKKSSPISHLSCGSMAMGKATLLSPSTLQNLAEVGELPLLS